MTPCRDAVAAPTYAAAKAANQECRGDSLSSQAWWLIPRIREVDRLLRDSEDARKTVRESHPEVCFAAFHNGDDLASKHANGGIDERIALLEAVDDSIEGVYDDFETMHIDDQPAWTRRIGASNRDDLVDAMALALTAKLAAGDFSSLPPAPPTDSEGLPMEIVYVEP